MKKSILIILAAITASFLFAADTEYRLANGKVIRNPYIIDRTPATVSIGHDSGVMTLSIADLPEETRKALNFDPAAAKAYLERTAKQQAQATQRRMAEENQRAAAEEQKLQKRIRELEAENKKLKSTPSILNSNQSVDFNTGTIFIRHRPLRNGRHSRY
ncbi:MAG: hypothetical protein PHS41_04780 [Victivallaceae bacterium]|nr:hypothetical protein [Victivallaceae bacterium]